MSDKGPYASILDGIGRAREHWHVHEHGSARLDANAILRDALARGDDLSQLLALELTHGKGADQRADRVAVMARPDLVYGLRLRRVCPLCGSWRVHLHHIQRGVGCRPCFAIRHREGR